MFIAIAGTRFSGKSTVEDYLVNRKGFTAVRLIAPNDGESILEGNIGVQSHLPNAISTLTVKANHLTINGGNKHQSFLNMSPLQSPGTPAHFDTKPRHPLCFSSPKDLLLFVTNNWKENFITCDLDRKDLVDIFVRRPFFMLLSVDAPLMDRYMRCQNFSPTNLETFVRDNDRLAYGPDSLHELRDLVNIHVINSFSSSSELCAHLDSLDLLNSEHLRPSWDSYFMTLAALASKRSNCMKRRVGAVLVRDNRVLATGYNGTPRGLVNCNEGGCTHCNGAFPSISSPIECVCLHAEENALLEAGRERIGHNAVLYCNTCPCLKCTVKIIQTGVKTVVYNLVYKMDTASAQLFKNAGVELRRYDPNTSFRLPPVNDDTRANGL
ncbi:hypothetical protein FA13DRAFT_1724823 [Coprinellus micaceus]|uniref:Deoxycytidylate deaminase n=1 Tax=Coprinellus micaceus TaxID=71717 RepID=A0A4Y7TXI4_COPMI|nr:hypothetical protein FA13DRAFT_1724823 [Coprinellus micaceus]